MATVGLVAIDERLPSELSGGQQQRVALARALVLEPAVLLFDEPLSNLDARLRRSMREEIRGLQQRLGLTVAYVTHDQQEAMAVSDRIIVMERGKVAQIGTPRELYERPASEFVAGFMGEAVLFDAVALADGTVRLGPLTIRPGPPSAPGKVRLAIRPEAWRVLAPESARLPRRWPRPPTSAARAKPPSRPSSALFSSPRPTKAALCVPATPPASNSARMAIPCSPTEPRRRRSGYDPSHDFLHQPTRLLAFDPSTPGRASSSSPTPSTPARRSCSRSSASPALATSSGAAAGVLGRKDGAALARRGARPRRAPIAAATDLPVSADLENGFGDAPEEVAETIRRAGATGIVGASIEDHSGDKATPLYPIELAAARIAAAVQAARVAAVRRVRDHRARRELLSRPRPTSPTRSRACMPTKRPAPTSCSRRRCPISTPSAPSAPR